MRRIPLKEAQIGQVLATDAVNAQQMLLLRKGAVVTAAHLRMLKSWGVETLWVERPDAEAPIAADADSRLGIAQTMAARFGDTLDDPVMAEICRAATCIVSERDPSGA